VLPGGPASFLIDERLQRRPDGLRLGLEPPRGDELIEGTREGVWDAYRNLL
jgi:hypothetical protein